MTEQFLELLVVATLLSSGLILLVLAIRAPVARWLGPRWAYYLWLIPLLGLLAILVPRSFTLQFLSIAPVALPGSGTIMGWLANAQQAVLATWLIGAVLALAIFLFRSVFASLVSNKASRELSFEERQVIWQRCAGFARRVEVDFRMLSSQEGPSVAGLFRPVLLLPRDFFTRYTGQQQQLMLRHELQHLSRRDLLSLLLAGVYRCLFWFNPLVWLGGKLMRVDQELSCDERVVSGEPASTRKLYGLTMLQAAHPHIPDSQLNYPASFREVRRRTWFLRRGKGRPLPNVLGLVLLLTGTFAGVLLGAVATVEHDATIRPVLAAALSQANQQLPGSNLESNALEIQLQRLERFTLTSQEPPLTAYETLETYSQIARLHSALGRHDEALATYHRALAIGRNWPEPTARTLNGMAQVRFAQGNYPETLKLLARSESLAADQYTAATWAMRGFALTRLGISDQALICINRAISQSAENGDVPQESWFLAQAALRINQGDPEGSAQSIEAARQAYPQTPHAERLRTLDQFIQDSWEPEQAEQLLTNF